MTSLRRLALLSVLAVTACGTETTYDVAIMPRTSAGTPVMSDQGAIGLASYALGNRSSIENHPAEAARAMASIDYLAGALYENPHWDNLSVLDKLNMLAGRKEIRGVLGVAPGTPSQVVVNSLIAAAQAFDAGDVAAQRAALPVNVFTRGPDQTIALLTNLPELPAANVAAQRTNVDINSNCLYSTNCS